MKLKDFVVCFIVSLLFFNMFAFAGTERESSVHEEETVEEQTIDLNNLILTEFMRYDAFCTRYLSTNATLTETSDYTRKVLGHVSNKTLNGLGFYALALSSVYNATKENYYLEKLKYFVDTAINSSFYYTLVPGVGTIFHCPGYYYDGVEWDSSCMYTMAMGIAAVHLYKITGQARYKTLVDRIADESRSLIVVNNSTDQAWSASYYKLRDTENARRGVNRQGMIAYFYAWYGKEINSTYLTYVPLIVNWIWRSQLASGGLAYDIGGTHVTNAYTAFSLWMTINAYNIAYSQFPETLKMKMMNSLVYLRDKPPLPLFYLETVFTAIAYMAARKNSYFDENVSDSLAKSFAYISLRHALYNDNEGLVTTVSDYGFGWRWGGGLFGAFFSEYPFASSSFDFGELIGLKHYEYSTGIFTPVGWQENLVADELRDGGNWYGAGWRATNYVLPLRKVAVAPLARNLTESSYYWKINTTYADASYLQYSYPTAMHVSEIRGANQQFLIALTYDTDWKVYFANGTLTTLTSLASGRDHLFATRFMLVLDRPAVSGRRTIYIESPLTTWTLNVTPTYISLTNTTSLSSWRAITGYLIGHRLTGTIPRTWDYFTNLAQAYNTTQPISLSIMLDSYQQRVNALVSEASWLSAYQNAVVSEPRLIAHNLPETVSLLNWNYSVNELVFALNTTSETMSTTEVYVGNKGMPTSVSTRNSTLSWSYDASTKIITVNVTHISPTQIVVDWRIPGDVNNDGTVDIYDIGIISAHWYPGPPVGPLGYSIYADLNNDGAVDIFDIGIVSAYWTR